MLSIFVNLYFSNIFNMSFKYFICLYLFFFIKVIESNGQEMLSGNIMVDEYIRNKVLTNDKDVGMMLRIPSIFSQNFLINPDSISTKKKIYLDFSPIFFNSRLDVKRPYIGNEYGMIPAKGSQGFFSVGLSARLFNFYISLQPEVVISQNLTFSGFKGGFPDNVIAARFLYWNAGDSPERFGNSTYKKLFWGQSGVSFRFGSFELGGGTKNIWWGPGQWNSLILSNNAPGFPNVSFNTVKPAKSFFGSFEGQIFIGRLESSNQEPTQIQELNDRYFTNLSSDWRYINGIMISFSPKLIKSLSLGYARTYQYYNSTRPKDLKGWLPILEPMAKEKLFSNGNSVDYDSRAQSQQISVFGSYIAKKASSQIYFQFGRRDHALNWREFFLNPEHARAYQVGFIKLETFTKSKKKLQIRGEITNQQESVNRYLRYDLAGGITWHTHGQVRGFTNYGQPMGVGIGTGGNVQTLEISMIEDWNKFGILFERLENNQDFYYRAFGQQGELKPWIDMSTALLWNISFKNLFISTRLQGTYARNYQWGLSKTSTPEFPVSHNLFSVHSHVNLIYFWNRGLNKEK